MAKSELDDRYAGMMGDGTEEQNLGQTGNPAARIGEQEVRAAFDDGKGAQSRPAEPLIGGKIDQLAEHVKTAEDRQEALIDESLDESFPASDPSSPKHIV